MRYWGKRKAGISPEIFRLRCTVACIVQSVVFDFVRLYLLIKKIKNRPNDAYKAPKRRLIRLLNSRFSGIRARPTRGAIAGALYFVQICT